MTTLMCDLGFQPSPAKVEAMVTGLMLASLVEMQEGAKLPLLYSSGVRYLREPYRRERWQTASESFARKVADCEDLAAWRCAELRFQGEKARVHCYAPRPGLIHCVVRRENGTLEDPSAELGMKGAG